MTATLTQHQTPASGFTPVAGSVPAPRITGGLPKKGSKGANAFFEFFWHPERWDYSDKRGGWYPALKMVSYLPGSMHFGNDHDPTKMYEEYSREGWTRISTEDPRLGPWMNYVHGFALKAGGKRWVPRWVTPYSISKTKMAWRPDEEAHNEFLRHIVAVGIVPACDPMVTEDRVNRQRQMVSFVEQDVYNNPKNPIYEARYRDAKATLAGMLGEDPDAAINEARAFAESLRDSAKDDPQTCDQCGKEWKNAGALRAHKRACKGVQA